MPAPDAAGSAGARPEHETSRVYSLLALEDLLGDLANKEWLVRRDRTMGSPVDMEEMDIEEGYRQRAPPTCSHQEREREGYPELAACASCMHPTRCRPAECAPCAYPEGNRGGTSQRQTGGGRKGGPPTNSAHYLRAVIKK